MYTEWQERRNKYAFYPSAVELLHYLHNNGYRVIAITDGTADFTYHPEVQGVVELLINPQNSDCTKSSGTAYSFVRLSIDCESRHFGISRELLQRNV